MEDEQIKQLFENFQPQLPSDNEFFERLERNLKSVEIIKKHTEEATARRSKAAIIAACMGFIAGFLFSLALPHLATAVTNLQLSMPSSLFLSVLADRFMIIAWSAVGLTSALIAVNTYELSLSLLNPRSPGHEKVFK